MFKNSVIIHILWGCLFTNATGYDNTETKAFAAEIYSVGFAVDIENKWWLLFSWYWSNPVNNYVMNLKASSDCFVLTIPKNRNTILEIPKTQGYS